MNIRKNKKIYIFAVLALLAFALAVRLILFGSVPGGMNQDGAMAAVDAKALADFGTDRLGMRYPMHLTAWGFGQMSALLSYLMAPWIKLFGLSPTVARIPSLIYSMLGLGGLFVFSKRTFGKKTALIILAIGAINPWHFMQSRWAIDCNLFPHFLMLGMAFLAYSKCIKWAPLMSVLCFGLSMYCYGISIYTVPVFLLFACVYLITKGEISLKKALICALVYLLIAWPFIACMVINFFGLSSIETPLFTIPYFPGTIRSNDILFFSEHPLWQLWINLKSVLSILAQIYNGYVCNEVRGFGTMYYISIPFMIAGLVYCVKRFKQSTGCALVFLMFLTALLNGLFTNNVNINRLNIVFYPLIIFTGAGIYAFSCFMGKALKSKASLRRAVSAALAAAYIFSFGLFSYKYFTSYADNISLEFMEDFGQAMISVKDLDADEYCITPDAQYKGFWYVSELLTLFYHDIDANDYQSAQFSEKYSFSNPRLTADETGQYKISPSAVYVTTLDFEPVFDTDIFDISRFGRFITAVPKDIS